MLREVKIFYPVRIVRKMVLHIRLFWYRHISIE